MANYGRAMPTMFIFLLQQKPPISQISPPLPPCWLLLLPSLSYCLPTPAQCTHLTKSAADTRRELLDLISKATLFAAHAATLCPNTRKPYSGLFFSNHIRVQTLFQPASIHLFVNHHHPSIRGFQPQVTSSPILSLFLIFRLNSFACKLSFYLYKWSEK